MTPWVARLLLANVGVFLLTAWGPGLTGPLALVPAFVLSRPWTLLTYMFVHAGFGHIFFNMLSLFFFGPHVEARLGGRQFIGLYLASGLTGALLSIVMPFVHVAGVYASPFAHIVGASGAVFGVMLAFARYWPRTTILLWFFPVEARVAVVIMAVLALLGGFTGSQPGIAHFAHLGGFLGGFVYLKVVEARSPAARFRAQAAPAPVPRASGSDLERWRGVDTASLHPVNREEYDRVMAKVATAGAQALTPSEREFLDRFSARQRIPEPGGP